eukprot:g35323.t1
MLTFIAQTFEYRSWNIMLRLYRMLVWPLLEYCVQFWSPCYRKDIIKLEKVQVRFVKMLLGMEGLSYKERLDRLELFSLAHRKLRDDLAEMVVHAWNELPENMVEVGTIITFKMRLDWYMNRKGLEEYGPNVRKWEQINLGYLVGMDELDRRVLRDAAARLPNGEGTRAEICELLKDSQFLAPEVTSAQINTVVSGALDRLHYEKDPCVKYDIGRKLWIYLHRNRTEEEF